MTNDTRLTQLWEAVEAERIEEEQFYAGFMEAKTLKEKAETGYAWYPIQFTSSQHTINDYLEVKIERTGEISGSGKFREGSGVQLILVRSGEKETLRGTISRLTKKQMWLLCKSDDIDDLDLPLSSANAVELIYDERPYLIMKEALTQVKSNQKEAIVKLKKFIYDKDARQKVDDYQLQLTHDSLNEGQRAAIAYAMGSAAMGVIHGPPGTGKTTTLIGLIQEVLSHEVRVLVCASSNHAVDLLAAKCLDAGLSTLRLGNVSRISEKVMEASLNEKVRNNKNWPQIKKWRIEADEIRKKAAKLKRAFGKEEREQRRLLFQEAKQTLKYAESIESDLIHQELTSARVIVTTLISSSSSYLDRLNFETLIIDEASQATEPECWVAILRAKRVILAGDHKQLPPTVKSETAQSKGLSTTLLDVLIPRLTQLGYLSMQYRMNLEVLAFPNLHFYDNTLVAFPMIAYRKLDDQMPGVIFIDTAGTGFEECRDETTRSIYNPGEVDIIIKHIMHRNELLKNKELAIISPYAEQVRFIHEFIKSNDIEIPGEWECDTIDGFQGQEKDVVYISLVRSNENNELGFITDMRRLNVALTRARMQTIIVGDSITLSKHPVYADLIRHAEKYEGYSSAWEWIHFDA